MCLNNDEEDTIVGNFTSKGIDTLHVEEVMPILLITTTSNTIWYLQTNIYLKSNFMVFFKLL